MLSKLSKCFYTPTLFSEAKVVVVAAKKKKKTYLRVEETSKESNVIYLRKLIVG